MKIDIFTLCDSSQVYEGKMVVMGATSSIIATQMPLIVPSLSLAIRLSFSSKETGKRNYVISIMKPSGNPLANPLECNAELKCGKDDTISNLNFNIGMNNIVFDEFGLYTISLKIDDSIYDTNFVVIEKNKSN